MTNYYDKQSAKVALSKALKENGWKIFGFRADESDMMTDYFSPASWEGIAEKNGFVLVIDQYGTGLSGKEVRKYDYTKTRSTSSKVAKLEATINDKASTEAEKETARKLVEKLNANGSTPDYEVLEVFPTFEHKTPKSCVWHIEKDGTIIAKGKGLYSLYSINDREGTKANMEKFVAKLEKHVAEDTQLVPVEKKVVTKVTKFVESEATEVVEGSYITLNINFTGGMWSGTKLQLIKVYDNSYKFVKLGKKNQTLKDTANNSFWMTAEKLTKWIEGGSISVVELKEVEEVTTKTVYVKAKRQQKTASVDVQLETTVVASEVKEETATTNETVEAVEVYETTTNVTMKLNEEKNGVELYFSAIPSEEVREQLKANGFRWSRYNKCWYSKKSEKSLSLAKKLAGEEIKAENVSNVEIDPLLQEEILEFVNIEQFKVPVETEKRLIDNSLFGDRRKVGQETTSLQTTLLQLKDKALEVIELTDRVYMKNKLIKGFNDFCERYTRELNSYLYTKSVNVPWFISGRGNINERLYSKRMDRVDNKMLKVVEMLDKQKSVLEKYARQFKKDKEERIKKGISNSINNLTNEIEFTTRKRELKYYGYTYNTRSYESDNYFFMNMTGCYRIFDKSNGKEVYSMKTTDKLQDAKNYVRYLESEKLSKII